jgi:hypothetical protein
VPAPVLVHVHAPLPVLLPLTVPETVPLSVPVHWGTMVLPFFYKMEPPRPDIDVNVIYNTV